MKPLTSCFWVCVLIALTTSRAGAVDLWPFNNEKPATTKETSGWSVPTLWPVSNKSPGPSTFEKLASGPKKLWQGTTDLFTPDPKPAPRRASRSQPSLFDRLFASEPENKGPQTVTEWMAQPRLDP